tara:strand:+ start:2227 stop:2376 length:150 start_codon:yes stop_codon:yes gene_type:complete
MKPKRKTIKCSRCTKTFYNGGEYREHYKTHLEEWENNDDQAKYIKNTTQ